MMNEILSFLILAQIAAGAMFALNPLITRDIVTNGNGQYPFLTDGECGGAEKFKNSIRRSYFIHFDLWIEQSR